MAYDVLGLGQPLLDQVFVVEESTLLTLGMEKGGSEQVSYEELQRILDVVKSCPHVATAGGSCSNTLKGLAILGEQCASIGKVGGDDSGRVFEKTMRDKGIICLSAPTSTPTGQVVCLVTPDGERTMRAYLGASIEMMASELVPEDFAETKLLHVEGYSLYNRALTYAALKLAKRGGAMVSLDLGSFEVVRAYRADLLKIMKKYVDIVFANAEEAFALTNMVPEEAVSVMAPLVEVAVVMCGADGCWVQKGTEKIKCPAYPVKPVDTTGAGDLFAAGFLHGYMEGYSLEQCARLGALCGAAVVEQMGAELPASRVALLKGRINDIVFTYPAATSSSSSSSSSVAAGCIPQRGEVPPLLSSSASQTACGLRHSPSLSVPVAIPTGTQRDTFAD